MDEFDVIVIGTGSGGKIAALELAAQGLGVLAVEAGRVGGECPYVSCVPSKSLLLSGQRGLSWSEAVGVRDHVAAHRDDTQAHSDLVDQGVTVVRGHGRLTSYAGGDLTVRVTDGDGRTTDRVAPLVVLATGSEPVIPDIPGLAEAPTWTTDQALSAQEQPERLLIVGGGAVGCELGQAFSRLGTETTLVETAAHLLPGEEPQVGEVVAQVLTADSVTLHVDDEVKGIDAPDSQGSVRVVLASGTSLHVDRILLGGGRKPVTADLGLEVVNVRPEAGVGIPIDARCRVLNEHGEPVPGLFAVGDVTEESGFTHSANYQARIVAAEVTGDGYDADYRAIPRVVYTDPPVFCVGLTKEQGEEKGLTTSTATFDVSEVERATLLRHSVPPPGRQPVHGCLVLVADDDLGELVGAACVGPEADSWGSELSLAIRARVPIELLTQHVRAFPTWSEAVVPALRSL